MTHRRLGQFIEGSIKANPRFDDVKPDTQAADAHIAAVELAAISIFAPSNQDWNEASDLLRQMYRKIASDALEASGLPAEVTRLQSKLEAEQEAHAQLQARCFDGCATGDSVFAELSRLRGELAESAKFATDCAADLAAIGDFVLHGLNTRVPATEYGKKILAALKDQQP